jgi:hypothetical protein
LFDSNYKKINADEACSAKKSIISLKMSDLS